MLMQSACCVCLSDHLGNHKCVFFMFLHIRLWVGGGLEGRRGGGLRKKVGMCYICPTLQCALCIKCSRLISCLEAGTLSKKCKQTPPSIRGSAFAAEAETLVCHPSVLQKNVYMYRF